MTRTSTSINLFKKLPGTAFVVLFSLLMMLGSNAKAQLVYNEQFSMAGPYPSLSLPYGWLQGKWGAGTDADNYFDRVNIGTNPAVAAQSAPAMLRYRSWSTTAGEASFIATKKLDMRGIPAGGAPISFSFYRGSGFPAANDRIQVYVNNAPTATGATLLNETGSGSNVIPRYYNFSPTAPMNTWVTYNYNIPQATWNDPDVYVIIVATSAFGDDMYIDNFSVTSYPVAQTYTTGTAMVVNQNTSTTAKGATNQQIIGCKLTVDGAATPISYSAMQFNTNGSTSPNPDITNAKLWFTGGTNTFDPATATQLGAAIGAPAIWATNYTFPGPWTNLEHGDNYFWITYDIAAGATSGNFVDAEWLSVTIGATAYTPAPGTIAGSREIDLVYCIPSYSVGTAWLGYQTNDYIRNVVMAGDAVPPPGISNNFNWITSPAGPSCPPPVPRTCWFQTHPPDYELFAAVAGKTTSITADGTTNYPISLQVGTYGSGNAIAAWIDYNKDGIFQATEKIAQSGPLGALGIYNTTFIVPVAAVAGKTRMRVREVWINYNIDPCAPATYGETEDYVVTIVPDCPGATGWTTWLGFTDDWTDPSNWCPSIPPVPPYPLANVKIPGGPSSAGYTYIRPVIRAGVTAYANQLNVEANDTIYIDAPSGSSLTVNQELRIVGANSVITINSELNGEAEVLNGQLTSPAPVPASATPLNNQLKCRSFLVITQAELLSQGLLAGDQINTIRIPIQRNSSSGIYNNFQMSYWYTNNAFVFTPGVGPLVKPPLVGPPAAPVIIRASGPLSLAAIPGGTWDTIDIVLTTPFNWSGTGNKLVIEMSYQNAASTTSNDQPRFTQTTGFRQYLSLIAIGPNATYLASEFQPPTSTTMGPVGAGVSTNIPVGNSNILAVGMTVTGAGIAANTFITAVGSGIISINNATTAAVSGNRTFGTNLFGSAIMEYRPNLIFKYNRPYTLYPITVKRDWVNNGSFFPGISRVTLDGTALQRIQGTDSTTFYDLTINNNQHVMLEADAGVTDVLHLQNGRLKLNNRKLTLTNSAVGGLTRANGFIQSDHDALASNVAPFGRFRWNMGTVLGLRSIPFVNSTGSYIPLTYDATAGSHDPTFATYNTAANNTNIPSPTVTNIYGFNGTGWNSDGSALVDRYFMIENPGAGATSNITFRWASTERSQTNLAGAATMSAQRWLNAGGLWEFPFQPGQTSYTGDSLRITGYSGFPANNWWVITGTTTPLPVTLLDFAATPFKDKVKLHWTTASELNNSHFEIQRTVNHDDFQFIGRVDSRGPSNNIQEYATWDMSPVEGIQYYYLHQYDFDGRTERFGPVSATFSRDLFDIVTTTVNNSEQGVTVIFNYNSTEPYSYKIMDVTGRVIAFNDNNKAEPGTNMIEIPASLSKGVYHIVLQNSSKTVSRKFFY